MERSLCSLGKDLRLWLERSYTCSVLCNDGVERGRASNRSRNVIGGGFKFTMLMLGVVGRLGRSPSDMLLDLALQQRTWTNPNGLRCMRGFVLASGDGTALSKPTLASFSVLVC